MVPGDLSLKLCLGKTDLVEARLGEAGLDDVARAYIIYRRERAELRAAKALLGVRDELKLSLAAVTVLRERYLLRDEHGRPAESTGEMMDRAAGCVAAAEDEYRPGSALQWAERFSALLRRLEFLPNSPTMMNAGTDLGLLAGCFVLPVEDSLRSIFKTLGQAAEIQRAGGGTGYAFSHLRPAGDRVATTGGTASGPVSFLQLYDTAARVVSMGGRRRGACMAVLDVSHPDICDFVTTKAESPSELTHFNLSVGVTDAFPARGRTPRRAPSGQPPHRQECRADACRRAIRGALRIRACMRRSAGWRVGHDQSGPTRCRGEAGSRRPTRAERSRFCPTNRATSARSTSRG